MTETLRRIALLLPFLVCTFAHVAAQKNTTDPFSRALRFADSVYNSQDKSQALAAYMYAERLQSGNSHVQSRIRELQLKKDESLLNTEKAEAMLYEADKAFRSGDIDKAREILREIRRLSPRGTDIVQRVQSLSVRVDEKLQKDAEFANAMAEGQQQLEQSYYEKALERFTHALSIRPEDTSPAGAITQTQSKKKAATEAFTAQMKTAEQAFAKQQYEQAMAQYRKAAAILPENKEVQEKIRNTGELINYQKELKELYASAIQKADAAMKTGNLTAAANAYREAADFNPDEEYPKEQLRAILALENDRSTIAQRFESLVNAGEAHLTRNEIIPAFEVFSQAALLKPSDAQVQRRLRELKPKAEAIEKKQKEFEQSIASADAEWNAGQLEKARTHYQTALKLKPGEIYPANQITLINNRLEETREFQARFDALMAEADRQISRKEYTVARNTCNEALTVIANQPAALAKIRQIDELEGKQAALDEQYTQLIAQGDQHLLDTRHQEAKDAFLKALAIKPGEAYPKQKAEEAESAIQALKAAEKTYTGKIAMAEKYFKDGKLPEAKTQFLAGLELRPGEPNIISKIKIIDSLILAKQDMDTRFVQSIEAANNYFAQNDYDAAESLFRQALVLRPQAAEARDKIKEIERIRSRQAQEESKVMALITSGEKLIAQKDYNGARKSLTEALEIRPGNPVARRKLMLTDSLAALELSRHENYLSFIALAEGYEKTQELENALDNYTKAIDFKPGDKTAAGKIASLEKTLNERRKKEELFQQAINAGDAAFALQQYQSAIQAYQTALGHQPKAEYPLQKIAEAETIIRQLAMIDENFKKSIAEADALLKEKKYPEAKNAYQTALAIKPSELYPQKQIRLSDSLMGVELQLASDYRETIASADRAFDNQDSPMALSFYEKALTLKPGDSYSTGRIELIRRLQAEKEKAENEAFALALSRAETLEQSGDLKQSAAMLEQALTIKPGNKQVETRIATLNQRMDDIRLREIAYSKAIRQADSLYSLNQLQPALAAYRQGLQFKPGEIYPANRISEIQEKIRLLEDKAQQYARLILEADNAFSGNAFNAALQAYEQALTIQPGEPYPTERIGKIKEHLREMAIRDENYTKAIQKADAFYATGYRKEALDAYQEAIAIKPEEVYPKNQSEKISAELREAAEKERLYAFNTRQGDSLYRAGLLGEAIPYYRQAETNLPEKPYPGQRIKEIDNILKNRALLEASFTQAIRSADSSYDNRLYSRALSLYLKASNLKPSENYPKERLAELNALLSKPREVEGITYERALASAQAADARNDLALAFDNYLIALHLEPHRTEAALGLKQVLDRTVNDSIGIIQAKPVRLDANTSKVIDLGTLPEEKTNNYIVVKLAGEQQADAKIVVNFGRGRTTTGGLVVRLLKNPLTNTFIGHLSGQSGWTNTQNSWISLLAERTDVQIESVYISKAK